MDPIDHTAAWRGEELFARSDWNYRWSDEDLDELETALERSTETGHPVEESPREAFPLPRLTARLAKIQHDLEHGSGACLLEGFPVAKYSENDLRRIFWGLLGHVGTAVSQSAKGEKIFSVRDEGYLVGQPQARGPNTKKSLNFHTDRCDVIAFFCLRQAPEGGDNQLVSSLSIFNELARSESPSLRTLMEPFCYLRHNVDTGNARPYCEQPIFSIYEGHFAGSYLRVLIDRAYALPDMPSMSEEQAKALDVLERCANDPSMHVTLRLKPGDMLLLNNWVTFHRRDAFEDLGEADRRRHLLRMWLAVPNSRPLDPHFEANYGSTEAGAVRGGMRPRG